MAAARSRTLLHRIALTAFVAMLGVGIAFRDAEAVAFSAVILAGILLLPFRKGLLGRIVLALVLLDVAGWMVPAAVSNVQHPGSLACVAVPVGLAAIALAGIAAAVGVGARVVPLLLLVAAGATVAYSQTQTADASSVRRSGDIVLSGKNVRFSKSDLSAQAGTLALRFTNHDLFWHTITIDQLGLDLRVPVGATRRTTFEAPPGIYEFYCAIPGHRSAGMHGTLTVK